MIIGYHFTGDNLRDGRPLPAIGEWLVHNGPVRMCQSGLHYSPTPWDALRYAPGPILHRVEVADIVATDADKGVCRRRRILQSGDATEMLRYFARMQALSVIHLWAAPDVVLDWLMTGDESLQYAAREAAQDAAREAAQYAAWATAQYAAREAAQDAAQYAARAAAQYAAWATAQYAARAAVQYAARAAVQYAAQDAARDEFNALAMECFDH